MQLISRFSKNGTTFPPWQQAFTMDAMRRAWLAVRAKRGTAGPDGETVALFEQQLDQNLRELRAELMQLTYRPRKVTQVLVPRPGGDWRPITLWTIRDRVAQRAVHNYLEPHFERHFLDCSYGFRPGRSTGEAAQAVRRAQQAGARWVLDADIKDCFGHMQDQQMMRRLRRWQTPGPMCELIQRWLRAHVWNAWQKGARRAGTSQGGVISPLLCNVYLHPFDQALQRPDVWLVRYADDFVCLARDEQAVRRVQNQAAGTLQRLGLELHPQKTRITHFDEGFQFVGWFFIRDEMHQLK